MKKASINKRKTRFRISRLLSPILMLIFLFASLPVSIPAHAAQSVTYKLEITTDSKADGWNKATFKIGYKTGGSSDILDIKDELSEGKTMEWTFMRSDAVPYYLQMYLDFGGGFTVRHHSGRVRLYADGEEMLNEPYSAYSYPFSSSDTTLDFTVWGMAQTELVDSKGEKAVYPTFKHAWKRALGHSDLTVKLTEDTTVSETLETEETVNVDLNGHLLNNAATDSLFVVKNRGKLSIIDSDPTRDTGETFFCTTGMKSEEEAESRTYPLKGGGIYHGGTKENGGIVNIEKGGSLSVEGCTFTDCHSGESSGGAIYCEGDLDLKDTKFIFCTALEGNGGAICVSGKPDISLEGVTFERCSAENGGAISFENVENVGKVSKFDNCTFNNCQAEDYGGGYYNTGRSNIDADGLTFTNCRAECGGGLYITSGGSQFDSVVYPNTISNSKFENCSAEELGGGVGYRNAAELTLQNVEFNGCKSEDDGGAISLLTDVAYGRNDYGQHDIRITDCAIHHCTAEDEGGGVYIYDEHSTEVRNDTVITGTSVHDNTAKKGGGVYVESGFVYLVNSTVMDNTAKGSNGGGVYVDSMYDIDIAGVTVIRGNIANGVANNLCLQNGNFSSAKMYSGGLEDGAFIGISSTSTSSSTVAKNISQYQVSKYLRPDAGSHGLSMTNTKEVSTPIFASLISQNISLIIIIGGIIVIVGVIGILYYRKRRKEGRKDDGEKTEQADSDADQKDG